jgi:hypothetical protein
LREGADGERSDDDDDDDDDNGDQQVTNETVSL